MVVTDDERTAVEEHRRREQGNLGRKEAAEEEPDGVTREGDGGPERDQSNRTRTLGEER